MRNCEKHIFKVVSAAAAVKVIDFSGDSWSSVTLSVFTASVGYIQNLGSQRVTLFSFDAISSSLVQEKESHFRRFPLLSVG